MHLHDNRMPGGFKEAVRASAGLWRSNADPPQVVCRSDCGLLALSVPVLAPVSDAGHSLVVF